MALLNVLFNNKAAYKNIITPKYALNMKQHYIDYHRRMEVVSYDNTRVANQETENNLSGMFTNITTS